MEREGRRKKKKKTGEVKWRTTQKGERRSPDSCT